MTRVVAQSTGNYFDPRNTEIEYRTEHWNVNKSRELNEKMG